MIVHRDLILFALNMQSKVLEWNAMVGDRGTKLDISSHFIYHVLLILNYPSHISASNFNKPKLSEIISKLRHPAWWRTVRLAWSATIALQRTNLFNNHTSGLVLEQFISLFLFFTDVMLCLLCRIIRRWDFNGSYNFLNYCDFQVRNTWNTLLLILPAPKTMFVLIECLRKLNLISYCIYLATDKTVVGFWHR